jgi:hypothetical protein
LNSYVIGCVEFKGEKTGKRIYDSIQVLSSTFDIKNKIFKIVCDNGSNVLKAVRFVELNESDNSTSLTVDSSGTIVASSSTSATACTSSNFDGIGAASYVDFGLNSSALRTNMGVENESTLIRSLANISGNSEQANEDDNVDDDEDDDEDDDGDLIVLGGTNDDDAFDAELLDQVAASLEEEFIKRYYILVVRCFAHTLQLAIRDSLGALKGLEDLMNKCFAIATKSHTRTRFVELFAQKGFLYFF